MPAHKESVGVRGAENKVCHVQVPLFVVSNDSEGLLDVYVPGRITCLVAVEDIFSRALILRHLSTSLI